MSDELVVGEGATTFDFLCHKYPWLQEMWEVKCERVERQETALKCMLTFLEESLEVTDSPGTRQTLETQISICKNGLE